MAFHKLLHLPIRRSKTLMISEGMMHRQVTPSTPAMSTRKTKKGKNLPEKMKQLYETLRDYKDPKVCF